MKNQEQQDTKPWGIGQRIAFRFIFVYLEGAGYGHITSGTSNFRKVNFSLDSTMNLTIKPSFDTTAIFECRVESRGDHQFVWQGISGADSLELVLRRNERNFRLDKQKFMWVMEQKDFY